MSEIYTKPQGSGPLTELFASVRLVAFDFDGVFTDNTVYVTQDGIESVRCWRSDGIGMNRMRAAGVESIIISTEINPVVSTRARKLKTFCMQGVEDKAKAIVQYCQEHGIDLQHVAFVGNDINDIPAFREVGLPIAVADAYPEVLEFVAYRTLTKGGYGAVREVCDLIVRARGLDVVTDQRVCQ